MVHTYTRKGNVTCRSKTMKRDLKKFAFTNELFEGGDLPFLEVLFEIER